MPKSNANYFSNKPLQSNNVNENVATKQNNDPRDSKVEGIQDGFLKQFQYCFLDSLSSELLPAR